MSEKILALDIATKCWWAIEWASWTWDLKVRSWESNGMKLVRLRAKVREVIMSEWIHIVYYERPAGLFKSAIIHEAELIWAVKSLLEELWVNYSALSPTEIKKHATGKWTAKKSLMIEKAIEKFHKEWIDDNEADALWIYDLAKELYHK